MSEVSIHSLNQKRTNPFFITTDWYSDGAMEELTMDQLLGQGYKRRKVLEQAPKIFSQLSALGDRARDNSGVACAMFEKDVIQEYRSVLSARSDDVTSHYIHRLANCLLPNPSSYVDMEVSLYKMRLSSGASTGGSGRATDVPSVVLDYFGVNVPIFELPISSSSLRLLRGRWKAVVHGGRVYTNDNGSSDVFREELVNALRDLRPVVQQQQSSSPELFQVLSAQSFESEFQSSVVDGTLTLENLKDMTHRSFPMCMQKMVAHVESASHLKHTGRTQLGLFVRNGGMAPETCLQFWRQVFGKKFTSADFDKKYAPEFEHLVGLKGAKKQLTGFGCRKMIESVTSNAVHGCCFKVSGDMLKKDLLHKFEFLALENRDDVINEICALAEGQHYQVACARVFEVMHTGVQRPAIRSPNEYFDLSLKHYEKITSAEEENTKKEQV